MKKMLMFLIVGLVLSSCVSSREVVFVGLNNEKYPSVTKTIDEIYIKSVRDMRQDKRFVGISEKNGLSYGMTNYNNLPGIILARIQKNFSINNFTLIDNPKNYSLNLTININKASIDFKDGLIYGNVELEIYADRFDKTYRKKINSYLQMQSSFLNYKINFERYLNDLLFDASDKAFKHIAQIYY